MKRGLGNSKKTRNTRIGFKFFSTLLGPTKRSFVYQERKISVRDIAINGLARDSTERARSSSMRDYVISALHIGYWPET